MFVGHTRFSLFVPDSGAWRASNGGQFDSVEEYRSFLYADDRLDLRTKVFVEHTVPTLAKAAEGFEVVHIVSYSESLPQKYQVKLEQAAREFGVLKLDKLPEGDSGYASVGRIAQELGLTGVFGRYRLDDDDILSTEYFKLVERYVKPELVGMVVSLPLGVEAVLDSDQFFNLREAHVPMNSMGLLYVCERDANGSIKGPKGGPHDKSDRYDPVILDATDFGYLRCIHAGQDNAMRYEDGRIMNHLLDGMSKFNPVSNPRKIRAAFPTVSRSITAPNEILDSPKTLSEDVYFEFDTPTRSLSALADLTSHNGGARPALVSLTLVDSEGNRIPQSRRIPGIGVSKNSQIGPFVYLGAGQGNFEALASIHTPEGMYVRAFRIMGLGAHPENVVLHELRISHTGDGLKVVEADRWQELQAELKMRLSAQAIDLVHRKRHIAVTKLRSIQGKFRR
ncbi:glycosyltransferase [Corynebacterium epidermidicanis]|uniref:Putative rhamnosyl transferase n=1 Tax=Corynebacterium epidermidicanis TaxID=1050174 RepID=A0A0G3GN86_9CORY|nr:glycosyltransferase [Corynebacterium epidermidicanis]AKK02025.1 Putative rhamnosyl transferase [Corynebacterium epidermidicanis]